LSRMRMSAFAPLSLTVLCRVAVFAIQCVRCSAAASEKVSLQGFRRTRIVSHCGPSHAQTAARRVQHHKFGSNAPFAHHPIADSKPGWEDRARCAGFGTCRAARSWLSRLLLCDRWPDVHALARCPSSLALPPFALSISPRAAPCPTAPPRLGVTARLLRLGRRRGAAPSEFLTCDTDALHPAPCTLRPILPCA